MKNRTVVLLYLLAFSVLSLGVSSAFISMAKKKRADSAAVSNKLAHLQNEVTNNFIHSKNLLIAEASGVANKNLVQEQNVELKKASNKSIFAIADDFTMDQSLRNRVDTENLTKLKSLLNKHSRAFNKIASNFTARGDDNEGLRAELAANAKLLSDIKGVNPYSILRIRTAEKNFLLLGDEREIKRVEQEARIIISESTAISGNLNTVRVVDNYLKSFNALVKIDQELGIRTNSGHYAQMVFWENKLTQTMKKLQNNADKLNSQDAETTDNLFLIYGGFVVLLSLVFSALITNSLVSRIQLQSQTLDPVRPLNSTLRGKIA